MSEHVVEIHSASDIDYPAYAAFQRDAYRDLLASRRATDAHMTSDYYRWKYHTPDGMARVARVVDEGETVSSSAMLPLRISVRGKSVTGWHCLDVATLPRARRRGCFLATLQALKNSIPPGDLLFAFPNASSIGSFLKLGCVENDVLTTWISPCVWADFRPFYPKSQALWYGVAVPESDVLGALSQRWLLISLVSLALLVGGTAAAVLLARRYGRQLKSLPKLHIDKSRFEDEIYGLVHEGESETLEFKSTMRMNLRSGKAGKEIELAWLKAVVAFMNTNGGILLIGVDDSGEILGTEPDGFENEDKCRLHFKNLLNQHIGLEYSKYLQFHVQPIEGKPVIAIECDRAADPAYLHAKGDESFLIRSGPSSVQLSISQALKYIESRR